MKIKIQQIDKWPLKIENVEEGVWDFSLPNNGYQTWFLCMANDPPYEMRITCETEQMREAMTTWWSRHYREVAVDGQEVLYQEGDRAFGVDYPKHGYRLRTYISPKLEPAE